MKNYRIRPITLARRRADKGHMTYLSGYGETIWRPYIFWVIEGAECSIIVDSAISAADYRCFQKSFANLEIEHLMSFEEGLATCGLTPDDVDIVYSGMIPRVVSWDEVTQDVDGSPVHGPVTYELYISLLSDHSDATSLGEVDTASGTVDVSGMAAGYYYVGVLSIDHDAEGNPVPALGIGWSNDPAVVDPTSRFAYLVLRPPRNVEGLLTLP